MTSFYRAPNLRFAYTYKDTHPIWCSLISDECLFYTRHSLSVEECKEFDEDPVLVALENDISAIRTKNSRASRRIDSLPHHDAYEQIKTNLLDGSVLWEISQLWVYLNNVTIGKSLMREVSHVITGPVAAAEYHDGTLIVNNHRDIVEVALASIKAIRRARNPIKDYVIDHLIVYNRLIEADSLYWMFRWSWEKYLSGDSYPLGLYSSIYHDLARSGMSEAMENFRSLKSGKCGIAIAEMWFLQEYCRAIDNKTIVSVLADYNTYGGEFQLTRSDALKVSELRGETNYLSDVIAAWLVDPIFSEVRSRRDANLAWFIKFERSFEEKAEVAPVKTSPRGELVLVSSNPTPPEHVRCRMSPESLRVVSTMMGETDGTA